MANHGLTLKLLLFSCLALMCESEENLDSLKQEIVSLRKQLQDLEGQLPRRILASLRNEIITDHNFDGCGGSIDTSKITNLTYLRRPAASSLSEQETCVWILWTNETSKIGLNLKDLNVGDDVNSTKLVVHSSLWADSLADVTDITKENLNKEIVVDSYLAVLVFSSTSSDSPGFNLTIRNIQDQVKGNETEFGVVTVNVPNNLLVNELLWTLSYPIEGGEYQNNERSFFLFYPGKSRKMLLTVDFSDTEPHVDFLSVFVYSKEENRFVFDTKFSGRKQRGDYRYESEQNSPILLYFHSDSSSTYDGFRVSYRFYAA